VIRNAIKVVEDAYLSDKPAHTAFQVGDTIDVHIRIKEGDRERVQIFSGTVLGRRGRGTSEMFTVRRIVADEGVERTWPLWCPSIAKIEVKRRGKVRRAKLYYLRGRKGKATRIKELRLTRDQMEKQAERKAQAEG